MSDIEESAVEQMEEGDANNVAGNPADDFIVDLDASALLAMDAPGGSRSPSAPEASLPHDATGQM